MQSDVENEEFETWEELVEFARHIQRRKEFLDYTICIPSEGINKKPVYYGLVWWYRDKEESDAIR